MMLDLSKFRNGFGLCSKIINPFQAIDLDGTKVILNYSIIDFFCQTVKIP